MQGCDVNIIEGIGAEEALGDSISVTVVATGFEVKDRFGPQKPEPPKVYDLDGDDKAEEITSEEVVIDTTAVDDAPQATLNFDQVTPVFKFDLEEEQEEAEVAEAVAAPVVEQLEEESMEFEIKEVPVAEVPVVHVLDMGDLEEESSLPEEIIPELKDESEEELTRINHGISAEQMAIRSRERMDRLRDISFKLRTPSGLSDLEKEPAYKRRNVELDEVSHSSESEVAQYSLSEDKDNNVGIKPNNFLHDNVD